MGCLASSRLPSPPFPNEIGSQYKVRSRPAKHSLSAPIRFIFKGERGWHWTRVLYRNWLPGGGRKVRAEREAERPVSAAPPRLPGGLSPPQAP